MLERIGLLRRDESGVLSASHLQVTTELEPASEHVARFHQAMIRRAANVLTEVARTERDISSITLCVDASGFEAFKKRLQQLRRELLDEFDAGATGVQVVQLNLQLFPVRNASTNRGSKMRTLSVRARITTALCGLSLLACALSACSSSSNGGAGTHPGNGSAGTNTGNGSCLPQWCLFPGTLVAASGAKYRAEFDATIFKPGFIALPTLTITGGPVEEDSAGCREGTTGDIQIEIAIPAEHVTRDANGNLHVSWSGPDDPEITPSAVDLTITADNTVTGTLMPMPPSDGGAPEELTVAGKMSLDCGVMGGHSRIPLADGTTFALTCGVQPAPAGLCNDQP